jgi:hypothetical protein
MNNLKQNFFNHFVFLKKSKIIFFDLRDDLIFLIDF